MDIALLFLIWTLSSALASHLARKKGYNPLTWGIFGFLGGLIACLIIFILPVKKKLKTATVAPSKEPLIWFYLDKTHTQHGPVSYNTLLKQGKNTTYVWNETMKDWAPTT